MPRRGYGAGLAVTLRSTAAAYGYALLMATTMGMLTSVRGKPATGHLFLFAAGGLAAFAVLEGVLQLVPDAPEEEVENTFPFAGVLNVFSVAAGLGAAAGIAHGVQAGVAWLLAPLAATALYMLVVAAQVAVVAAVRDSRGGH